MKTFLTRAALLGAAALTALPLVACGESCTPDKLSLGMSEADVIAICGQPGYRETTMYTNYKSVVLIYGSLLHNVAVRLANDKVYSVVWVD